MLIRMTFECRFYTFDLPTKCHLAVISEAKRCSEKLYLLGRSPSSDAHTTACVPEVIEYKILLPGLL